MDGGCFVTGDNEIFQVDMRADNFPAFQSPLDRRANELGECTVQRFVQLARDKTCAAHHSSQSPDRGAKLQQRVYCMHSTHHGSEALGGAENRSSARCCRTEALGQDNILDILDEPGSLLDTQKERKE